MHYDDSDPPFWGSTHCDAKFWTSMHCDQAFWILHDELEAARAEQKAIIEEKSSIETQIDILQKQLDLTSQREEAVACANQILRDRLKSLNPRLSFTRSSLSRDLVITVFGMTKLRERQRLAASCGWFKEVNSCPLFQR